MDAQYIRVAKRGEFDTARYKKLKILARNVAIFKDDQGELFATESSCKHQNWDLTTGALEGDLITCPRHHWTYNIRTGECLNHDSAPLRRYGLKVEGDDVYITMKPLPEDG